MKITMKTYDRDDVRLPASYGHGNLGRIYERLRKRSYRSYRRVDELFDRMDELNDAWFKTGWGTPERHDVHQDLNEIMWRIDTLIDESEIVNEHDHHIYLRGVKDALDAVQTGFIRGEA
jgi:hypothetical protein